MLDRRGPRGPFGLRTVLATAGAVLVAAAAVTPAAAASPAPPAAPVSPTAGSPAATGGQRADRAQSVGSGRAVLVAAGFSGVALLAAGIGFAYSRRQHRRSS